MIEWKEGAVFSVCDNIEIEYRVNSGVLEAFNTTGDYWFKSSHSIEYFLNNYIIELNEPREGYYIPKSELDNEEKYNQAVEVFGLCGYVTSFTSYRSFIDFDNLLIDSDGDVCACRNTHTELKVKITFDQLMAIGELKRKMNERDAIKKGAEIYAKSCVSATDAMRAFNKISSSGRYRRCEYFDQLSDKVVSALINTRIFDNSSVLPNGSNPEEQRKYDEYMKANESKLNGLGAIEKPAKKRKSKEAYRILESMGIEWDNVEGKWYRK